MGFDLNAFVRRVVGHVTENVGNGLADIAEEELKRQIHRQFDPLIDRDEKLDEALAMANLTVPAEVKPLVYGIVRELLKGLLAELLKLADNINPADNPAPA
jgi:hypothetical protein